MITENILKIFLVPLSLLLGGIDFVLPALTLPATFLGGLEELIGYVGWILPLSAILPIFIFKFGIMIFNVGWKLILRIKSFIPTMGG